MKFGLSFSLYSEEPGGVTRTAFRPGAAEMGFCRKRETLPSSGVYNCHKKDRKRGWFWNWSPVFCCRRQAFSSVFVFLFSSAQSSHPFRLSFPAAKAPFYSIRLISAPKRQRVFSIFSYPRSMCLISEISVRPLAPNPAIIRAAPPRRSVARTFAP